MNPKIFLSTKSGQLIDSIDGFVTACKKQQCQGSIYLLGGLASNLCDYLDIIVSNKYPIKDVHLLTPDNRGLAFVCFLKDNMPVIRFSYKLEHNYDLERQNEDSSNLYLESSPRKLQNDLPNYVRSEEILFAPLTTRPTNSFHASAMAEADEGPENKKIKY